MTSSPLPTQAWARSRSPTYWSAAQSSTSPHFASARLAPDDWRGRCDRPSPRYVVQRLHYCTWTVHFTPRIKDRLTWLHRLEKPDALRPWPSWRRMNKADEYGPFLLIENPGRLGPLHQLVPPLPVTLLIRNTSGS